MRHEERHDQQAQYVVLKSPAPPHRENAQDLVQVNFQRPDHQNGEIRPARKQQENRQGKTTDAKDVKQGEKRNWYRGKEDQKANM